MRGLVGIIFFALFINSTVAYAQECDSEKCISVTADDENHVVITEDLKTYKSVISL
ncbi:MAG: hypothetical protein ACKO5V_02960 [Actinomycetota bacterium]